MSAIDTSPERRVLPRIPVQLKFRVREDRSNLSYGAHSTNINRQGVQIETSAQLATDAKVELWGENTDLAHHYVGGKICWVQDAPTSNKYRYGIKLGRPINWAIPLQEITNKLPPLNILTGPNPSQLILDAVPDGIFGVDKNKRIISFNKAAEALTGWQKSEVIGRFCREVFKANTCQQGCALDECIARKQTIENQSIFITHARGNRMGVNVSSAPMLDSAGKVIGGLQIFRGARCLHNRAVILDNIGDGVFTVDSQWHITSFNRAAEEITGIPRADAIGHLCSDILQSSICGKDCPIACSINRGQAQRNKCIHFINANQEKVPVSICAAPMYDIQGNLMGGVETFRDLRPIAALHEELQWHRRQGEIISQSPAMDRLFELLPQIAKSESTILITGESGTGKELVAKAIHDLSERQTQTMITINCGALPDTLLEAELFGAKAGAFTDAKTDRPGRIAVAEGGTLFLDEIGEISPAMQVKLLRVLQNKTYEALGSNKPKKANIRILAATNRDLEELIAQGLFRKDLFYRLNVAQVTIPPLRERIHDVPLLINHFINKYNLEQGKDIGGISDDGLELLLHHGFPGNVRELQNIIEYAFILCPGGLIQAEHLPPPFSGSMTETPQTITSRRPLPLAEIEKQAICNALKRNEWKRMKTCRELGISKDTLRRKIRRYQLNPDPEKLAEYL